MFCAFAFLRRSIWIHLAFAPEVWSKRPAVQRASSEILKPAENRTKMRILVYRLLATLRKFFLQWLIFHCSACILESCATSCHEFLLKLVKRNTPSPTLFSVLPDIWIFLPHPFLSSRALGYLQANHIFFNSLAFSYRSCHVCWPVCSWVAPSHSHYFFWFEHGLILFDVSLDSDSFSKHGFWYWTVQM